MYVSDRFKLSSPFLETSLKYYGSKPESVDFGNATKTAKIISSWVERRTKDRIKDLMKPDLTKESTKLALVNAVYFKGTW